MRAAAFEWRINCLSYGGENFVRLRLIAVMVAGSALFGCNRSSSPKPGMNEAGGVATGSAGWSPSGGPAATNPGSGSSFSAPSQNGYYQTTASRKPAGSGNPNATGTGGAGGSNNESGIAGRVGTQPGGTLGSDSRK